MEQALTVLPANILEAIKPFQPDDGHKGTFLVLRIAGMEQATALRIVNRKYRSWQNWKMEDEEFRRVDSQIPYLADKFGGEARVIRTALLDISIIEVGIGITQKIIHKEPVSDGMWAYVTKLAGIRVPMMGAREESGSPWERLANSIRNTQREITVKQEINGTRQITATETTQQIEVVPSQEQRDIAKRILQEAGVE